MRIPSRTYIFSTIAVISFVLLFITLAKTGKVTVKQASISAGKPEEEKAPQQDSLKREYSDRHIIFGNFYGKDGYLRGTIKNTGARPIGLLRIAVYFLDPKGSRIEKKEYTAISVISLLNPTETLGPNGSIDFERDVQEYAPSNWSGKVETEVTNIEFDDELKKEFGISEKTNT